MSRDRCTQRGYEPESRMPRSLYWCEANTKTFRNVLIHRDEIPDNLTYPFGQIRTTRIVPHDLKYIKTTDDGASRLNPNS